MMKAHELIDSFGKNEACRLICANAEKFDLGEIDDVHDLAILSTGDFYEIPAPICLFQFSKHTDTYMMLAADNGEFVRWIAFTKIAETGGVWQQIQQFVDIWKNGNVSVKNGETGADISLREDPLLEGQPLHRQWAFINTIAVARMIEVFSCCNVDKVSHDPPKFINQKRVKKGKIPFYSYKTLHIAGKESNTAPCLPKVGGHASPRLHFRRGHIRRLENGNRVWVRASLVGDNRNGEAGKDYRVVA